MKWPSVLVIIILLLLPFVAQTQDALNLPTELYILLNDGRVERYGLGADGVQAVTPEDEFVVDFGIAGDDNWLAYRTQDGLYIGNVFDIDRQQLMDEGADVPPIRGDGETLVWSPDNLQIAYTTLSGVRVFFREGGITDIPAEQVKHLEWSPTGEYLVAETTESIWWIYRRVGRQMNLTSVLPSSQGITWLSDTSLVFAPNEGGLLTMDLSNNNQQMTLLDASQVYSFPYRIEDGLLRVFARSADRSGFGRLLLVHISKTDIVTEEIGQDDVEVLNIRWTPTGNLLIAFQGGVLALVEPQSAQGFTLPVTNAVSYDWGTVRENHVNQILAEGDVYFLGQDVMGVRQVWTLAEDGTPFSLTPATGNITDYDVSPNGQQITYVSQDQLWLYNLDNDELTSLVDSAEQMRSPSFSRDGSQIVYSVDTVENSSNGGIWLVNSDGEDNTQVLPNGSGGDSVTPPFYRDPQFAPNINALLVKASGSETNSLSIIDVNTLEVLPLGQYDDGFWLSDGRVVAWGTGLGIGNPQASEIVVLDPNTQQDPIPLFTLPEDIVVERVIQVGSNDLRLITRQRTFGPSSLLVVRVPINGTFERLFQMTPLIDPVFSVNGVWVAGLTHPNGNLALYTAETDTLQTLTFPTNIAQIVWR